MIFGSSQRGIAEGIEAKWEHGILNSCISKAVFPHLCKTASLLHSPAHLSLPDRTTGQTGCSLQCASMLLGAGCFLLIFSFQQSPRMSQNADLCHPPSLPGVTTACFSVCLSPYPSLTSQSPSL